MGSFDEAEYEDIKTLDTKVARTSITVPPFHGQRYEDTVPDTLDLADRAELAIHAITRMVDPTRDYLTYTEARFSRNPPVIGFTGNGSIVCAGKHLEALPLLRVMSGSTFNLDVDARLMESMLHMTAKDGSVYIPKNKAANPKYAPPVPEPLAVTWGEGRQILAMCMWYQHDSNPLWRELIEKKIIRLAELATEEEDYAYYNREQYLESEKGPLPETFPDVEGQLGMVGDASHGFKTIVQQRRRGDFEILWDRHESRMLSRSLCIYYRLTGHEPALELAGKIVRGVLKRWKGFEDDGRWLISHFHRGADSLLAMLEYAAITEDSEVMAFVERCYDYAKAVSDDLVGFFPEIVPGFDIRKIHHSTKIYPDCETCEVGDMINLGLRLTSAGVGDYWEEVERWVRNQFVENQLTQDKLDALLNSDQMKVLFPQMPVEPWQSDEVERALGGFAGHAMADDFGVFVANACCTGNGARTLYWVWDSILTREDNAVRVNLLLNRASPWLDVDSYLPNQGKVALKIKQADAVSVRIPEWTDHAKVTCNVDGTERSFAWSGDYVQVGGLKPGAVATIEFPIRERTLFRLIGDIPYKVTIRGNTVVDMESAITDTESVLTVTGEAHLREGGYPDALRKEPFAPLYQRDEYRTTETPTRKTTRFVSDELIEW